MTKQVWIGMGLISLLISLLSGSFSHSQEVTPLPPPRLIKIHLNRVCEPHDTPSSEACSIMKEIGQANLYQPIRIQLNDEQGRPWKVHFFFGPNRTRYSPTDVHLRSSQMNLVLKHFTFKERTSLDAYDFTQWKTLANHYQWIDEPTNTIMIEFSKGPNVIFINVFHPKFLTSGGDVGSNTAHWVGTLEGKPVDETVVLGGERPSDSKQPDLQFQNTYRQVDWQLGYGRTFTVLKQKRSVLNSIPHVEVGITSGQTSSSFRDSNGVTHNYEASPGIEGTNFSLGNRLEYHRNAISAFTDVRLTLSRLQHPFLDGSADYRMRYLTGTFGVGVRLFQKKSKPQAVLP